MSASDTSRVTGSSRASGAPRPAVSVSAAHSSERRGADARLLLPAAAGWAAAAGTLALPWRSGWWFAAALGAAGVVTGLAAVGRARARARHGAAGSVGDPPGDTVATVAAVLLVACGTAMAAAADRTTAQTGMIPDLIAHGDATVVVTLRLSGDPLVRTSKSGGKREYVLVPAQVRELTRSAGHGRSPTAGTHRMRYNLLVIAPASWRGMRFHDTVTVSGTLRGGDRHDDVILLVRGPPGPVTPPGLVFRSAERVRAGLRAAMSDQPPQVAALVPALVAGDVSTMPAELDADFATTGLTHLAAVSGTNLTLLLAFVLPVLRLLGLGRRGLTAAGLLVVAGFVVLARPQPSVLRAAVMGLVALLSLRGNARSGVRAVSLAVWVLVMVSPQLSVSVGFALSVSATLGLVLFTATWCDELCTWLRLPDRSWLPKATSARVAEAIACPLAAQVACTPIIAAISSQVSWAAVLANLAAGPAVGVATIGGFAVAGIAVFSIPLAGTLAWIPALPARWILWIATRGARLPGAASAWSTSVTALVVLSLGCIVAMAAMPWMLRRRWAAFGTTLVLVAWLLHPVRGPGWLPGWPPAGWLVVACDVGQGDLIVANAEGGDPAQGGAGRPGDVVVIDTGPDPDAADRCLQQLGAKRVRYLLLTHQHADHTGGLAGVMARRQVDATGISPYVEPVAGYRQVLRRARGVPTAVARAGESAVAGGVRWQVLWPPPLPATGSLGVLGAGQTEGGEGSSGSAANNASVVVRVTVAGVSVLLTGDLETEAQQALVSAGADLRADVLKVAHHGSSRQLPAFVAATGARVALISVGRDNDYGHPSPKTLRLLGAGRMRVLRTDESGSIALVGGRGKGLGYAVAGARR